jgi:gliding motility-associated-like protein
MKQQLMKFVFILLILFNCPALYAQQGNIWYFGYNAGVDFNYNPPRPLTDGRLVTEEGCAAMSDSDGHLLFYTDGVTVYNRHHRVMLKGDLLHGNRSTTQSATIIPWPGKKDLYYIITASDVYATLPRYSVSVLDMAQDGGDGGLDVKNALLSVNSTEKLTVAKHCNGVDFWIICKLKGNNEFHCFLLNEDGLSLTPVISAAGRPIAAPGHEVQSIGYLKVSPDSKKLALATFVIYRGREGFSELLDFDNATGTVSNAVIIKGEQDYGVEFSPDSRFLYISYANVVVTPPPHIDQFDLSAYIDSATLEATRLTISSGFSKINYGMQLGPDGKIYVTRAHTNYLDIIHNPNERGIACDYKENGLFLNSGVAVGGLPNIIPSLMINPHFDIILTHSIPNFCRRIVQFDAQSDRGEDVQYEWDFGDGTTSNLKNPVHTFGTSQNEYTVTVKLTTKIKTGDCYQVSTRSTSQLIRFDPIVPHVSFQANCITRSVGFRDESGFPGESINGWYWDFGDGTISSLQHPVHIYKYPGTYEIKFVAKSGADCPSDTLRLPVLVPKHPVLGFEMNSACQNAPVNFKDTSYVEDANITAWYWDFGDGRSSAEKEGTITFNTPGPKNIRLAVQTDKGCSSDTLIKTVSIHPVPSAAFDHSLACIREPVVFTNLSGLPGGTTLSYEWKIDDVRVSSSQHFSHSFPNAGTYTVSLNAVAPTGCSATADSTISVEEIAANAGQDMEVIAGQQFQLNGSGGIAYQWSPGRYLNDSLINAPRCVLEKDQLFRLKVSNAASCSAYDEVFIRVYKKADIYVPNAFTPNGDGKNDLLKVIPAGVKLAEFKIYNRWGSLVFSTSNPQTGWNGYHNGQLQNTGSFVWIATGISVSGERVTRKGTVVLLR